ncbi:hypothetical protein QAD02_014357 [Eretmocerus hayati]|uniref:Uncharacterized protein n=1 Tax=Eretmocerus hayati TaxID=131215 RepID=A0ACC2P9W3_9HYME|nr:hypothetical protein QAD02_014357 [Eretmocerus hayati]
MILLVLCALLIQVVTIFASSLASPPQSAVIIAFENAYDLSLLANTISDLGIETTFVISSDDSDYYEHLVAVEVIKINSSLKVSDTSDIRASKLCKTLISDASVKKHVQSIQPTFIIFPAVRHDACLLPWAASISSIPVIYTQGHNEELYVFIKTGMALPIHQSGFLLSIIESLNLKYFMYRLENDYISRTQQIISEKLPLSESLDNLYSGVQLVLWGADPILRMNSAILTQLVTEIGCHHCRGPQPLPADLQKELVEFRAGTIISLLDYDQNESIIDAAQNIPSGRQGLAILWKNKYAKIVDKPHNLFIHRTVDRQDLIGYPRTRMVLCHCTDSEFLESSYHGTPMVCFPRTRDEKRNAQRAVELGFARNEKLELMSHNLAEIIKEIHENTQYRESARIVSQAIRDRSNHAMDRIQYWLGYTARHNGEGNNLLVPKKVSTYGETLQAVIGFLVGVVFTALLTVVFFVSQQMAEAQKKEMKKKQHRK